MSEETIRNLQMLQCWVLIIGCLFVLSILFFGILFPHYCELYDRYYKKGNRKAKERPRKTEYFISLFFGGIRDFFYKSCEMVKRQWSRFVMRGRSGISGGINAGNDLIGIVHSDSNFCPNVQAQATASATQTHSEQTASEPLPAAPCSARPVVPWSEVIIDLQNDITTSEIAQIAMALVTPGRLSEFQLKRLSELPDSAKRHFWIGNYRLSEIQIQTQEKRNLSWRSSRIGGLFSSLLRRLGWLKKRPSPSGQRPQEDQISK